MVVGSILLRKKLLAPSQLNEIEKGGRIEALTQRLEMLVFDGWNPEGWIFRVERFVTAHHITEEEKFTTATISLDGEALAWFQWEDGRQPIHSWGELTARLLDLFSLCKRGSSVTSFFP